MFLGRIFLQLSVAKSMTPRHKEVETGRILPWYLYKCMR